MDKINDPTTTHQGGLNDPILTSIEHYWHTLRHARHIPVRNDLDPSKIDRALPYAFILQRVAPGTARFRVAGQRIHDLLKMDARGMPFSTLFQPEARDVLADLIENAFCEPAILGLPLLSACTLLRPRLQAAIVLLPMQDDKGQTNRLLGGFVTDGTTQSRPRRFEIDSQQPIRHQALGPQLATTRLVPRSPAPSERSEALQHPTLRLVVNNG